MDLIIIRYIFFDYFFVQMTFVAQMLNKCKQQQREQLQKQQTEQLQQQHTEQLRQQQIEQQQHDDASLF